jgi:hypothetical protein
MQTDQKGKETPYKPCPLSAALVTIGNPSSLCLFKVDSREDSSPMQAPSPAKTMPSLLYSIDPQPASVAIPRGAHDPTLQPLATIYLSSAEFLAAHAVDTKRG